MDGRGQGGRAEHVDSYQFADMIMKLCVIAQQRDCTFQRSVIFASTKRAERISNVCTTRTENPEG